MSADHFDQVLGRLAPDLDLDALAFATGAIERRRVVVSDADLLRLSLARGPGGLALDYWLGLQRDGATPPGLVDWGTTPQYFLEARAAMIWHTAGNLSNIRTNAPFPFRVAMLPAKVRRGSPTGAGTSTCSRRPTTRKGRRQ